MPKGFSEREKELIRARLLENGRRAFSTYGLRKTSVEDLTRAIGISKGAFYIFYDSKEALFMDVVEGVERDFRRQVLAEVERPGPTPRARLKHILQVAFSLWKTTPILRQVTQVEYALLVEKMPPDRVQEHVQSDQEFIEELIRRCREAGILIKVGGEQISGLMYAIFFVSLHEDDIAPGMFPATMDVLLELIAAYCVGEVSAESGIQGQAADEEAAGRV